MAIARVAADISDVPLLSLEGLVSQDNEEDVVVNSNALSRGDKRRNARLTRLRELVPVGNAVLGIDLADTKQAVVLTGLDSQVVARKRVNAKAWQLGLVLDWAQRTAKAKGFTGVTVGCEPTGHRWRVLEQLAGQRSMPFVCVNPMLVGRARETEDYTRDKTDDKDAVLIAGLVTHLNCYVPEPADETWARLRQLGARRERLITEATACLHQLRDLLECAWPGVLEAAGDPFRSSNWCAALAVVLNRCDGHPERLSRWTLARFEAAVVKELPRWGGTRRRRAIIEAVFTALVDPSGVWTQRRGALERASWVLQDWHATKDRLAQAQACMLEVLDELELTEVVTSIPGLSAIGAAAILAETGDPTRFHSPRALVKHAGLAPRENASGAFRGQSHISRRGRPRLRLAAWRAAWGALHHNPVMAARYRYLTTRQDNPLADGQARAAIAAALLRWLHVVTTSKVAWDPHLAGNEVMLIAA